MSSRSRDTHFPVPLPAALRYRGYRSSEPAIRSFCPGRGSDLAWVPDETNDTTTTTVIAREEEYLKELPLQTWPHLPVHMISRRSSALPQGTTWQYFPEGSVDVSIYSFARYDSIADFRITPRLVHSLHQPQNSVCPLPGILHAFKVVCQVFALLAQSLDRQCADAALVPRPTSSGGMFSRQCGETPRSAPHIDSRVEVPLMVQDPLVEYLHLPGVEVSHLSFI